MLTGKHADSQIDRQTVVAILRFPVVGGVTSFNSNFTPYTCKIPEKCVPGQYFRRTVGLLRSLSRSQYPLNRFLQVTRKVSRQ